jgi:hypothetical protein
MSVTRAQETTKQYVRVRLMAQELCSAKVHSNVRTVPSSLGPNILIWPHAVVN